MQDVTAAFHQWGRQTIMHAMTLKAEAEGVPFDEPSKLTIASRMAERTANWLWEESVREAAGNGATVLSRFTEKVLDWTWHHRRHVPQFDPHLQSYF
jgi:hypothetical protein